LTEARARSRTEIDPAAELVSLRAQLAALVEQQTAVNEVLRSISASAFDLDQVLQTVTEHATRLSGATQGILYRRDGDVLRFAAGFGPSQELMEFNRANPIAVGNRGTLSGRVALDKRTIHLADVLEDAEYTYREAQRLGGFRAMLGVPLMIDDDVLGTLSFWRTEPVPFNDKDIAIVETFARQAAVAIQNVRLLIETKEALAQQTATSEVLKTISLSAFDLQPVFDSVVENATKLCRGDWGYLFRRDGDVFRIISSFGRTDELLEYERTHPTPIVRSTLIGRVALDRAVVHLPDLFEDPDYDWPANRAADVHTVLGVPIFKDSEVVGVIGVARNEKQPFNDAEIRLVRTFADQAAIAMENVRLFNETKESLSQQTALSDVLRTISRSAFDLDSVLQTIVERAAALGGADTATITRRDGDEAIVLAQFGTTYPGSFGRGTRIPVDDGTLIGRALLTGSRQYVVDAAEHPDLPQDGPRTRLGIPFLRDGKATGVLGVSHILPKPFSERELQTLETFADQAAIAIENVRLFNETKESLERQTALAEILRVIASSPSDQQPVVDAIARNTTRYCGAEDAAVFLLEGEVLRRVAHHGAMPVVSSPILHLEPGAVAARAVLERHTVHVADITTTEGDDFLTTRARAALTGQRGTLATPLLREGTPIGVILLRKREPTGFTPGQIRLVEAFADQAVIAIENVRLFNETKEALERQTSISDVLQTIGRSAFDLQPVLDTVVERAVRLCDAHDGSISTLEDAVYRTRSYWSVSTLPPAYIEFMLREIHSPERGSLVGRTALEGRVVQIADVLVDPEYAMLDMQQAAGYRTVLGVPLLREGRVIGVFALTRNEVRPFTDRQIELVRTFADQAAIAIENTRLFAATKEALEQQTAVGEVLKTISRSAFDLQPVLDIVLNNAVRLAGADIGWLSRVENEQFTTVAYSTEFPESVREELVRQRAQGHIAGPWIPLGTGGGLMGFTLAEGHTVHLPDVKEDPELKGSTVARLTASRTVVGVPMLRDGRSIGGMVLARYEVRPFVDREIELVQTFADQAAIAIENVRLFSATKEALEQQTAVSEVLKTIGRSAFNLQPVLDAIIQNATELSRADVAWTSYVEGDEFLTGGRAYGIDDGSPIPGAVERLPDSRFIVTRPAGTRVKAARDQIMGRAIIDRKTIHSIDITADTSLARSASARTFGARTVLAIPMLYKSTAVGCLAVARRRVDAFSSREVELVETFADQAAIAIQNVRLFNEIQDKSQQLEIASRHKSEFLANMSHELRTPLNAIIGFSEVLLQGLFGEVNEKQREYLADVLGSGQHLLSLINDILDLSKIEAGRMDLELTTFRFRDALDSGLTIVRERAARHAIQLNAVVASDVGTLEADERKVKQILYNLLSNAVKFTPDGGRVEVSARAENGDVRVEVRDTGIGVAPDDQEQIFEEFRQVGRERSREGTGLGLTLTKRFVELHGGRIWLDSTPGQGSTFTFTLPTRRAAGVRA